MLAYMLEPYELFVLELHGIFILSLYLPLHLTFDWYLIKFLQKAKAPTFTREDDLNNHSKPLKSEVQNDTSRVGISKKFAATRSQSDGQEMKLNTKERNMLAKSSSGMASTWESMKMELRNFKSNIDAKRFIPLHQVQDEYSRLSSSESLDDIFSRIKRPIADHMIHDNHDDLDDYAMDRKRPG